MRPTTQFTRSGRRAMVGFARRFPAVARAMGRVARPTGAAPASHG